MTDYDVYVAGTRFGMGIRLDEASRIIASPKKWLLQQLVSPMISSSAFAALSPSAKNLENILAIRDNEIRMGVDKTALNKAIQEDYKGVFVDEMRAKIRHAITTPTPFYERLVDFWSNHFAITSNKKMLRTIAGSFEREAIRPYVTGKFVDMLIAVEQHPAMQIYLDNAQSIGPNSVAGERQSKGLNENLAREIMELHTLGVDGGYTQTDVTTFAKVITGWTVAGPKKDNPGTFMFEPKRHEPGTQVIMGKAFPDNGVEQGIAVLRDLAVNKATAHHIATKLARHFISDTPPDAAVAAIASVFLRTGGDLSSVYIAIMDLPIAWDVRTYPKVKSSYDLIISAARAAGNSGDEQIDYCLKSLQFLSGGPFSAESPAGLPDKSRDIMGPDAMVRRVEWAQMAANKFAPTITGPQLATLTIGPIISDVTRQAVINASNNQEAIAIVYGSPEFQRR